MAWAWGMGLIICSLIPPNIWVPWAQAYNLQFLKIIKAINQSINNTVHQYNINMNQQIQPEVSKDIIIKHNINHIPTWQHTITIFRLNKVYIDVVLLLQYFTKCI